MRGIFRIFLCLSWKEFINLSEDIGEISAIVGRKSKLKNDQLMSVKNIRKDNKMIASTFRISRKSLVKGLQYYATRSFSEPSIPRRALMYVPASDARKVNKAPSIDADFVVLDCEDGVAINQKTAARTTIAEMLNKSSFPSSKPQWGVRVNSMNSGLCEEDLNVILGAANKPPCILLPKVESVEEILSFTDLVRKLNPQEIQIDLVMYSETAASMMRLPEITQAAIDAGKKSMLRLVALVIGSDDYVANIGATRTKNCTEILYARQRLVMIAKAFELQAIDMVHIDIKDLDGLRETSMESAAWGFTGRQVIHPSHVPIVQAAYSPAESRIVWASELVKAFDAHQELGKGAFVFENQMIDMPTLRQAQNVVNLMKLSKPKDS